MPQKLNFLFWNINQKPLLDHVKNLVDQEQIDILILAENRISVADWLNTLNQPKTNFFYQSFSNCDRISIFTRFDSQYLTVINESKHFTIQKLQTPTMAEPILLMALHLPSQSHYDDSNQMFESPTFRSELKAVERQENISKTVIVGDFNMNPFQAGMIAAQGFHGVMDSKIALKQKRIIKEREYSYFYNPMWNFMGDYRETAGTYYYRKSVPVNYFWNTFDQVLISPELIPSFDKTSLNIITQNQISSFLKENGTIDDKISDHLPIRFTLNL